MKPHLCLALVALLGCGGPSTQTGAATPPLPREAPPPGLYGDIGGVTGGNAVGSNTPPLAMSAPPPEASSGEISTHRDGEQDLIAITGGTATPPPTGDPGDAGEVVARLQPSFRDCFDKALKTEPKAGGSVTLDVLLLPTGMVGTITPKNNAGLSQTVVKCATSVIEKARFRAPEGGAVTHIEIPLKFRPRS